MKTLSYHIPHHGRIVEGTLYLPDAPYKKVPLVVFSHGFGGAKTDFAYAAEALAAQGIAAFCYDFCGGSLHAQATMKTQEMTLFTEAEDLDAVLDTLAAHPAVDGTRICLFGASQGGAVSAIVAARREHIRKLVLLYPALCIPDDWNRRFPTQADIPDTVTLWGVTLGREFFVSLRGYDIFSAVAAYRGEVLLLHGDRDEIVPLAYSERAARTYQNASLVVFKGEGHGFSPAGARETVERLLEFLKA